MKNIKYVILVFFLICPITVLAEAFSVSSFDELKNAILNGEEEIELEGNYTFDSSVDISSNVIINGNNSALVRDSSYTGVLFNVSSTGDLTINNLIVDGSASGWEMDIANGANDSSGYFRADVINGASDVLATQPLILTSGKLTVNASTFQNIRNNAGASNNSGGAIRSTAGTLTINNTNFKHCGSYREGGAVYITGGNATIKDSNFTLNAAGVGYKARAHGGALYVNGGNNVVIDKTTFNNNFAQHNGGAIMLQTNGSNIKVTNSNFNGNSAGNDGAAVSLESSSAKRSIEFTDCVFDGNKGLALTGQSMGTLWLDSWKNDSTMPAILKNIVFKNNSTASGSAFASYGANNPYVEMDNLEVFNNTTNGVGSFFIQSGTYTINNSNVHDNTSKNGGAMASVGGDVIVNNSIIKNNTAIQRGGGPIALFGTMTIKNTEITNNHSNGYGGGIAAYSMYASYGSPVISLENVLVKDNTADISGGGLSIQDTGTAHSTITVDNASKIYNNHATVAADDVLYTHANSTGGASTTLDNIAIAGLLGIDGWYHDPADDRFIDTDNPTVFDDYVANDGSVAFYIKAAGISNADYDGNGGETNAQPVTIRYGATYVVDDDIPVRDGYEFVGWNTKYDGSGINLTAGDTYDGSDGFILYAIWNEIVSTPETNTTVPDTNETIPTQPEPNETVVDNTNETVVTPVTPETNSTIPETVVPSQSNNPKTGDKIILFILINIISLIGIATITKKIKYNNS